MVFESQNKADYDYVKRVFETIPEIAFDKRISVLVATDRLFGCAWGIYTGLQRIGGLSLSFVSDTETAEQLLLQKKYDFMLLVGYLKYPRDYKIVRIAKSKQTKIIMVANLDSLITSICLQHAIPHKLDRYKDIGNLPEMIKTLTEYTDA